MQNQTEAPPAVCFEPARHEDAKALALASWKSFDADINYGAPAVGGPPGYRSDAWQAQMMHLGRYFKILCADQIVGGFILFPRGSRCEVGRMFLLPEYQNQGIGKQAIAFMEQAFPQVRTWTLDTPRWNLRNQHFYKKMGFRLVGTNGPTGLLYEKTRR